MVMLLALIFESKLERWNEYVEIHRLFAVLKVQIWMSVVEVLIVVVWKQFSNKFEHQLLRFPSVISMVVSPNCVLDESECINQLEKSCDMELTTANSGMTPPYL